MLKPIMILLVLAACAPSKRSQVAGEAPGGASSGQAALSTIQLANASALVPGILAEIDVASDASTATSLVVRFYSSKVLADKKSGKSSVVKDKEVDSFELPWYSDGLISSTVKIFANEAATVVVYWDWVNRTQHKVMAASLTNYQKKDQLFSATLNGVTVTAALDKRRAEFIRVEGGKNRTSKIMHIGPSLDASHIENMNVLPYDSWLEKVRKEKLARYEMMNDVLHGLSTDAAKKGRNDAKSNYEGERAAVDQKREAYKALLKKNDLVAEENLLCKKCRYDDEVTTVIIDYTKKPPIIEVPFDFSERDLVVANTSALLSTTQVYIPFRNYNEYLKGKFSTHAQATSARPLGGTDFANVMLSAKLSIVADGSYNVARVRIGSTDSNYPDAFNILIWKSRIPNKLSVNPEDKMDVTESYADFEGRRIDTVLLDWDKKNQDGTSPKASFVLLPPANPYVNLAAYPEFLVPEDIKGPMGTEYRTK